MNELQSVLWNVATLQFSHYFSESEEEAKWKLIEKISRLAVGTFAALYVGDCIVPFLSLGIKTSIQGAAVSLISCFAFSLLLKGILYSWQDEGVINGEREVSQTRSVTSKQNPFVTPIKRSSSGYSNFWNEYSPQRGSPVSPFDDSEEEYEGEADLPSGTLLFDDSILEEDAVLEIERQAEEPKVDRSQRLFRVKRNLLEDFNRSQEIKREEEFLGGND